VTTPTNQRILPLGLAKRPRRGLRPSRRTRQREESGDGQNAHRSDGKGERQFFHKPPIRRRSCSPPRLWITAPAARKSSALKKACVTRWKMALNKPPRAAHEHIAELRDRRVGQHPLDVVLHQGDGRGENGRQRTHAPPRQREGAWLKSTWLRATM